MRPAAGFRAVGERSASGHGLLLADATTASAFPYVTLDASLWRYYVAATATDPVDVSTIERDPRTGLPTAALLAAEGPEDAAFFGRAATFELATDLPARSIPRVGRETAEALRDRARAAGRTIGVRVVVDSANLSGFERVLLSSGASVSLEFSAEADLSLTEEQLWTSLRKSFRPLINKGRRDLRIEVVDESTPDRCRFDVYRDLHREVAGRVTRPSESWDVMFEMVAQGRAQLLLAHLEGRPVAATYFVRFGRLALYASGAYVRDLGKFPVSHWPLYASMLEARRSGVERLVLGTVLQEAGLGPSAKEQSIAVFKRGFATTVVARRTYGIES